MRRSLAALTAGRARLLSSRYIAEWKIKIPVELTVVDASVWKARDVKKLRDDIRGYIIILTLWFFPVAVLAIQWVRLAKRRPEQPSAAER